MVRALGNEGWGGLPAPRPLFYYSSRLSFPPLWRQTPRPPGASLRGRGYAFYRGFGRGSPLTWAPAPESRGAFTEGSAAAFERDLNARTGAWILGQPGAGPQALGRLLAAITANLAEDRAAVFYTAAGHAARRAWREPGVARQRRERLEAWRWRDAIPERHHAGFAAGLGTH